MKALRAALALLLVISCGAVASRVLTPRLRCNVEKAQVNTTTQIAEAGDTYARGVRARQNIAICRRCLTLLPNDHEFQMLLGMNEHTIGEHARSEESYLRALELNERPEIYAYLAVTQLEMGKSDEARRNLVQAALFHMTFVDFVSPPLQWEVRDEVTNRHLSLRAKKR